MKKMHGDARGKHVRCYISYVRYSISITNASKNMADIRTNADRSLDVDPAYLLILCERTQNQACYGYVLVCPRGPYDNKFANRGAGGREVRGSGEKSMNLSRS